MQMQRMPVAHLPEVHTPVPQRFEKQASDMSYSATKQVRFTELQVNETNSDNQRHKTHKPPSILNNSSRKKTSHSPAARRMTYERPNKVAMKTNRSALSSLSSYTAKSARNRSARKAPKSSKSPNSHSIRRQQEEEYDRLSAKKTKRMAGKISEIEKRLKGNLSAKKRKASG